MKTAHEILNHRMRREGEVFPDWQKTFIVRLMQEYALQFQDKPVTELNERNSIDEGEKSILVKHKCKYCGAMTVYPDEECYMKPRD